MLIRDESYWGMRLNSKVSHKINQMVITVGSLQKVVVLDLFGENRSRSFI